MDKDAAIKVYESIKKLFNLNDFKFDIFAIKKLAETNTLGEKNGNQTHIAFTGKQADIFPYLDNVGYLTNGDKDFKKRFLLRIPIILSKNNLNYLNGSYINNTTDDYIKSYSHFNRSKRNDGSIQGELSYLRGDDSQFLDMFRRKLLPHDYLIILKENSEFNYLFIGIKNKDMETLLSTIENHVSLSSDVYYAPTNPGVNKNITLVTAPNISEDNNDINLEEEFLYWIKNKYISVKGKPLEEKAIENNYKALKFTIPQISATYSNILPKIENIFKEKDTIKISEYRNILLKDLKNINRDEHMGWPASGLRLYNIFLLDNDEENENISFDLEVEQELPNVPKQKILYGAPGTGKSYLVNEEAYNIFEDKNIDRITFYDSYTYNQFIGTYKPVTNINKELKKEITYEFIGGPLLTSLIKAYKQPSLPILLIIEEINRAKPDRVFGDTFQLLDRKDTGESDYIISISKELKHYLKEQLCEVYDKTIEGNGGLYFPKNLYIWATMNSSDQGVYPMDTAFKRRWDFEYISLNKKENLIKDLGLKIKINEIEFDWNNYRTALNSLLGSNGITEDRLISPFFIKEREFDKETKIMKNNTYINKFLMYLFDDVLRHNLRLKDILFKKRNFYEIVSTLEEGKENIYTESFMKLLNPIKTDISKNLMENN